ncbi:MAG: hypothetical protein JSS11_13820 [Verrucomicrobia bacterium]|nr:hypothetical protein [Verrucomicrobiota bacterium]
MNPLLAFTLHLPFGFAPHVDMLVVIFAFVLCVIIIKQISRYQRAKMWHETARLALEKGQPLPDRADDPGRGARDYRGTGRCDRWNRWDRRDHWGYLRRGLIQLAVGAALYFALSDESRVWALIPAFIGVANLVMWLIFALRADKSDDRRDPPTQA